MDSQPKPYIKVIACYQEHKEASSYWEESETPELAKKERANT
jgi:hypothetical protein